MVQYLRLGSFSALLSITSTLCGFGAAAAVVPVASKVVPVASKVVVGTAEVVVALLSPPFPAPPVGLPPSAVAADDKMAATARMTDQFRIIITILIKL